MLFFVFACLLGSSFVLGYSTIDRRSPIADGQIKKLLDNILAEPKDIPILPPGPNTSDDNNVIQDNVGNTDDNGDNSAENEVDDPVKDLENDNDVCLDYKDVVLEYLVGFPSLREMINKVDVNYKFLPIVKKGVSTFQLTNDAKTAAKHIIAGLTDELLNMKKHCPSTIFTRILIYAAGKSFDSVILQENVVFNELNNLMVADGNLSPNDVRRHTKLMLSNIINDFIQDVISRQFNESHGYLQMIYPIIVNSLYHGEMSTQIDLSLRNASREIGMTIHCLDIATLMELYRTVWNDLEIRHKTNVDAVLDVLPLSDMSVEVREQVREKSKVLLRRGVQMMKNILSGLRDERLGQLESEAQRLLNSTELEVLKKIVDELLWHDQSNGTVKMLAEDVMNIVVEKEMKEFAEINKLFKMTHNISMNSGSTLSEYLSVSLKLLSKHLNDIMRRKCKTFEKYLGVYGPPISECKQLNY